MVERGLIISCVNNYRFDAASEAKLFFGMILVVGPLGHSLATWRGLLQNGKVPTTNNRREMAGGHYYAAH